MSNTHAPDSAIPKDPIVAECLTTPAADWSPNLMAVFVDRLEYALFDERKARLVAVGEQLETLMTHVLAGAPAAVRNAVLDKDGDPNLRLAFLLGSLSFAQQFASTAAGHRPDEAFYSAFDDADTKNVVTAMAGESLTRPEIATATGLTLAAVQTRMGVLVELGIADFRARFGAGAEPGTPEYFLTPAAQQMAAART